MSFSDAWRAAGEAEDKFEPPVGTYQTKIVDGGAFTSRAGDDYAKVNLQIIGGEFAGRRIEHFMGFSHEVGARINREALELYGIRGETVDTVEDLDDAIAALAKQGVTAEVSVTYRNGYMSVKVLGSRHPEQSELTPESNGEAQRPAASFADAAKRDDDSETPF